MFEVHTVPNTDITYLPAELYQHCGQSVNCSHLVTLVGKAPQCQQENYCSLLSLTIVLFYNIATRSTFFDVS